MECSLWNAQENMWNSSSDRVHSKSELNVCSANTCPAGASSDIISCTETGAHQKINITRECRTTLYCSHPEIVVIKKAKPPLLTGNNNRPTILSDLKLRKTCAANGSIWKHTSITLREGGIHNFPMYHMMFCRVSGSSNESCGDEENEDENSSPEKPEDRLQSVDTERCRTWLLAQQDKNKFEITNAVK